MRWGEKATQADLLADMLQKPCRRCGAVDRFPSSGECRPCARARAKSYETDLPEKRAENARRAEALLREAPMTCMELATSLGLSQQRANEAIKDIGARIVGRERWAPIYALEERSTPIGIGRVSSVWQLGSL
jgi:hypothetical protein